MKDQIQSAQIVLPCKNFDRTLEFFTETLGFRVEMISPADAPSNAVISGYGLTLRLETSTEIEPLTLKLFGDFSNMSECEIYSPDGVRIIFADDQSKIEIPEGTNEFVLTKFDNKNSWNAGRAGMLYRDLIPSRLGGRFIASHISIPTGGEIPDYVHFHKIRFQMIYCISGWAKLVYEDQGEPFSMCVGDCVLQPPEIRHRVLESSPKFEVLEIGCPAIHETFAEHQLLLPNETFAPERIFGGQQFVHHIDEKEIWKTSEIKGFESKNTKISNATNGLADVRTLRAIENTSFSVKHSGEFLFFFILKGKLQLSDKAANYQLKTGDCFILPNNANYSINADKGLEIIRVKLPA
jgi:mannose-6-phosphate isomerase-like protein (cupin superfamily)